MATRSSPLPPRDRPPFDQADSATGAGSAALRHSFTPGPWTFGFEPYEDGCPYVRISAGEHGMFEDETGTGFNLSGIASEADGRLIATAPELYEAAQKHLEWIDKEKAGPDYGGLTRDTHPDGEHIWRKWWNEQLGLCADTERLCREGVAKARGQA